MILQVTVTNCHGHIITQSHGHNKSFWNDNVITIYVSLKTYTWLFRID